MQLAGVSLPGSVSKQELNNVLHIKHLALCIEYGSPPPCDAITVLQDT